jgi:outer membrane protein TolC
MMCWKHGVVGLAFTLAVVAGCKQQCFLNECDYEHYRQVGLTPRLECDPKASIEPATLAPPPPSTVLDPDRKIRYLSLAEAIAIALEQGRVGDQDPLETTLTSLINIGIPASSDTIRVLSLDPAISYEDIEASLARFDAQWTTSLTWTTTDEPLNGLNQFNTGTTAALNTSLLKPLPTGGVAGITFSTQYQFLTHPPTGFTLLNPAYTPRLQFQFEQPILQGYGIEINQLRASHPGSVLTPFPNASRVPGILITRLRFDEQRAEFQRRVNFMLRNVEISYWNLYNSYWTLYSREQAMRQAYEAWKINKARYEAGRIPVQDFAQTRAQYEMFRAQRLQQLGSGTVNDGVLIRERVLRALLGMPVEDGTRLVPVDAPTLTPYQPDWATAVNDAMAQRPELFIARQDLKFQQLNLINAKNLLLPDLRFTSTYALNGIGSSLDGTVSNALRSLASDRFVDWTVGLRLNYTLGYRDARAQVRQGRLAVARSFAVLREQEQKAQYGLTDDWRHLFEYYNLIQIERAQREAAAVQLQARFKEYQAGRGTLDILLESQRVWAEALRAEYDAITQYNNAIVSFEFSRGTIGQFDNVYISEGPLPHCAQERAVEHERERTKAIVIRERANPALTTACSAEQGCCGVPELPAHEAPTLPRIFDGQPPVPEISEPAPGESLSEPRRLNSKATQTEGSGKAGTPPAPVSSVSPLLISPKSMVPAMEAPFPELPSLYQTGAKTENSSKTTPVPTPSAKATQTEGSGKASTPPAPASNAALLLNPSKPVVPAVERPFPALPSLNKTGGKPENSSKTSPVPAPSASGVPGFIIPDPSPSAGSTARTPPPASRLQYQQSKKPDGSNQPAPPPSGVPGFIILSDPTPPPAPSTGGDKSRSSLPAALPPALPDGSPNH